MTRTRFINFLDDVVSSYDQTKTTIQGRVAEKEVNGFDCLGSPLTNFIDVFTETGQTPNGPIYVSPTSGRIFFATAVSGGVGGIVCYNFNLTTGVYSWLGRLNYNLPNSAATTHTIRALKVDDSGATWKVFVGTTGSVGVNGGLFMINGLTASDFPQFGFPTIAFSAGAASDEKAVYFLQKSAAVGAGNTMTACIGIGIDTATKEVYFLNGTAATWQGHLFNYTSAPTVDTATVTLSIASPGKVNYTAHPYNNNDQVVLSTTGALPTGLTAGTVYFVRNRAANDFELSTTSGGASINFTGAQSGVHTIRRAFGQCTNLFDVVTGNLNALTGTVVQANSVDIGIPTSGPNASNKCIYFATTAEMYEARLVNFTSGATSLASLRNCNALGTSIDYVAPTIANFNFSETLQKCVYLTNSSKFVMKPFQNNVIDRVFGSLLTTYIEQQMPDTINLGAVAFVGTELRSGWLFATSSTTGQRGISYIDIRSDHLFDYSYIISPVQEFNNAVLRSISTLEALFELTGTLHFFYRTSGFGSASGGWTEIFTSEDLNISLGDEVQFKVSFDVANEDASTPAQIISLVVNYDPLDESDTNWSGDVDNTSRDGESPTDITFKLQTVYATAPTEFQIDLVDDSNNITQSFSTVTDIANFYKSTDGGATFIPLVGAPNNTTGTRLKLRVPTPSGDFTRARIKAL